MSFKTFLYHRPASLPEMLEMIRGVTPGQFTFMGGGTDILLKMRRNLIAPAEIISLKGLVELTQIKQQGQSVNVGALVTLQQIKESILIRKFFPSLAQAAGQVGSPQLRNMGTLGGNICLDTRCIYYNHQAWEGAFEPCFKRGGKRCHVVKKGSRCYALFSADTPSVLLALEACLHTAGPAGERKVPITEFYQDDGLSSHRLRADEILTNITIPVEEKSVTSYARFSMRGAIDFPIVGVAVSLERSSHGNLVNPKIAATGLQSRPLRLCRLEKLLTDVEITIGKAGRFLEEGTKDILIVRSQGISPDYRRRLLKVLVEKALEECILKSEEKDETVYRTPD